MLGHNRRILPRIDSFLFLLDYDCLGDEFVLIIDVRVAVDMLALGFAGHLCNAYFLRVRPIGDRFRHILNGQSGLRLLSGIFEHSTVFTQATNVGALFHRQLLDFERFTKSGEL